MFKRLTISLLLMGLAAFGLGAAAFAWFSDSGSGEVTISAGEVDLQFRIDYDCDGEGVYDTGWEQANPTPAPFSWTNIVPGDTTADCIEVRNNSLNGSMTVFVSHGGWSGDAALRNATLWQYNAQGDSDGVDCLPTVPTDDQYDTGRGCELDTIAPGESFVARVEVSFPDTGLNQNNLQSLGFGFDVTLTGYTG